jgi:hypothetical protein
MPWSEKQVRTFRAIEHGWKPKKKGLRGLSKAKAGEMADEGVTAKSKGQRKALDRV